MGKIPKSELSDAFRKARNQQTVCNTTNLKGVPEKREKSSTSSSYSSFLSKYSNLEESFVRFTTQDLVYFFREKAKESGAKYVIANMKRDMGIFKKLKDNFEIAEILLMIEFIFSGDQTYLDIHRTQPTVLASNWVNTIYKDSIDWANDQYIDKKSFSKNQSSKREWKSSSDKKTQVGDG